MWVFTIQDLRLKWFQLDLCNWNSTEAGIVQRLQEYYKYYSNYHATFWLLDNHLNYLELLSNKYLIHEIEIYPLFVPWMFNGNIDWTNGNFQVNEIRFVAKTGVIQYVSSGRNISIINGSIFQLACGLKQ